MGRGARPGILVRSDVLPHAAPARQAQDAPDWFSGHAQEDHAPQEPPQVKDGFLRGPKVFQTLTADHQFVSSVRPIQIEPVRLLERHLRACRRAPLSCHLDHATGEIGSQHSTIRPGSTECQMPFPTPHLQDGLRICSLGQMVKRGQEPPYQQMSQGIPRALLVVPVAHDDALLLLGSGHCEPRNPD